MTSLEGLSGTLETTLTRSLHPPKRSRPNHSSKARRSAPVALSVIARSHRAVCALSYPDSQTIATINLSGGSLHPGSGDRTPFQDGFKHRSYPNDENPRPISRSAEPPGSLLDAALPTSGQIAWHSIQLSDRSLLTAHRVNDVVHASGNSTTTRLILLNHFNRPRKTHSNDHSSPAQTHDEGVRSRSLLPQN